ncbi:MAG: hypothetical protein KAU21_17585 [Gammaproteobacteria bacterium]|nr:hypothetical protein [Gammaproteobacteria bacterium]
MNSNFKKLEVDSALQIKLYSICTVLATTIFIIDLLIPLGVASAIPYILVILVSLWSSGARFVISLAIICTLLTLLGFYFSPSGGEMWKILFNRALAVFVIWVTAILILKWKLYEREMFAFQCRMEKEKEDIYLATIHGAQHITYNLLNELQLVELEIEKHPEFDKEISSMFGDMMTEAEKLLKDLSTVNEIDDKTIRQSIYPKEA